MPLALACASHSPLMNYGYAPDEVRRNVDRGFAALAAEVNAFSADFIIQFSPDHFNGFFYDLMPAFCVGAAAISIGDWGTKAGTLDVPEGLAVDLAETLLESGIDVALSYRMQIDHGFVQIWENMYGHFDMKPIIPIFMNCAAKPLPRFRRARLLGEAVGRFAAQSGKRVLIAASGGLSHDPPTPQISGADEATRLRLIDNRNPSAEARAAREQRVILAGQEVVEGKSKILPVDSAWDKAFLERFRHGEISEFDDWNMDTLVRVAGRGGPEVLCWVAAMAALRVMGPVDTTLHCYEAVQGWIAGMAILSGATQGGSGSRRQ